jgi:Protein of unknown function (DUF3040)
VVGAAPANRIDEKMHRSPAPGATKEGTVPLSEHEQRLLDQIEQALYADDPKFAATVRSVRSRSRSRSHPRRMLAVAVVGGIAGLALVLVGLVSELIAVSVAGFVLLVAACGLAAQQLRRRPAALPEPQHPSKPSRPAGLRSRMEDRLRRRFDEN